MGRLKEWGKEIFEHKYLILFSLFLLAVAIFLDYLAGIYVNKTPGVVAPDLILDHIPTLDLDLIFIYGDVLIIALIFLFPLFFSVKQFHKAISQFSLLIIVRAAFTTFTHLETPLGALKFHIPNLISIISFQNDMFFSGHTAVPFLGFLLFKDSKIRYFFLASSIVMAATVLFMHVHYTIDVFSAFFITYGVYKIGERLFKRVTN